MTSNANDLRDRIRRRTEAERQKMDAIAARELQTFGETLRASVSRHAAYHRDRYGDGDHADTRAAARAARAAVARLPRGPGDRGDHLADHLRRELGAAAVAVDPACRPCSRRRRPCSSRSPRHRRRSTSCRRRRGACGSTRRTGCGTWCCPAGRSRSRGGRGPCTGSLPCGCRASEGVV